METVNEKTKISFSTAILLALIILPLIYRWYDKTTKTAKEEIIVNTQSSTQPKSSATLEAAKDYALTNPGYDSFFKLGLEYYGQKQYENSAKATLRALQYNPKSAIAYNNLCSAYNALEKWDEAASACREALKLDPGFQLAKNNLNWSEQQKSRTGKKN